MRFWNEYQYKNLTIFLFSLLFAFVISRSENFHSFLLGFNNLGYISIFLAGMLFVSTFTVSIGVVILLALVEKYTIFEISIIAGMGAVAGDMVIFKYVKDSLAAELSEMYNAFDKKHLLKKLFRSKYFRWTPPVLGAIIIASPLPDEIGVSLMGLTKMKTYQFVLLSFTLNTVGILFILLVSKVL